VLPIGLPGPAEAHAHLDLARASAPATPEMSARLDALQAEIELWHDHETAAGSRAANRALAAAEEMVAAAGGLGGLPAGGRRAYLDALEAATDAALQEERADDVMRLSEASLLVAQELDEESHLSALMRTGLALRPLGDIRESEARFRRAWDVSQRLVLPTATLEAGHGLARALRDLGRLEEARAIATETLQLEARLGHPPGRWGNAPAILHSIELSLGDPAALRAMRDDAKTEPNPHYRLSVHQNIATWQARADGERVASQVEAELAAARSSAALAACPRCAAELSVVSAELLARIGRVDDAKRELAAWEQRATADYPMRDLWRTRAQAAIAVAERDDRRATSLLTALDEDLERGGFIDDLLWARLDLGRALARSDRQRSVEALRGAAALAEQIGAISQARLASQELRRLGVRAWRRGRAAGEKGLEALSAREREVARLVADGETNREIAEALRVSPKTVERHLTNVLAKLGLRNRTELASLVRSAAVRGSPDE
jgi:DNA-binding CsgD family transcriptional regulator